MKQLSILGCGWLGLPLAKALLKKGFTVKGTTTTVAKISDLETTGIIPFLLKLESNAIAGDATGFLNNSETLLINIPPQLRQNAEADFVGKIKVLLPFIEKSGVKNVLFVSSTSVYSPENGIITEETPLHPDTESGRQLVLVEQLLLQNPNFKTTIVRFGGLVGPDRNPIRFLAGKQNLPNPFSPINFIHLQDCIGIIIKIIETQSWGEVFNAVSPYHPNRENYYQQKAAEWNLVPPTFDPLCTTIGKTISSDKLASVLKYTFVKTP